MSYEYEDYLVEEKAKSYMVSEIWDEDPLKVRIDKSLIKSLELKEEPEMLAIVLGKIELLRIDFQGSGKQERKRIIKNENFKEKLTDLLNEMSIEDIIMQLSEMKYHEIKEYVLS